LTTVEWDYVKFGSFLEVLQIFTAQGVVFSTDVEVHKGKPNSKCLQVSLGCF